MQQLVNLLSIQISSTQPILRSTDILCYDKNGLTSVVLQLSLVAYAAPRVFAVTAVASCGPAPDSQTAALKSEVAFGRVLIRKTFEAPADSPNMRTFSYGSVLSINKYQRMASGHLLGFPQTQQY